MNDLRTEISNYDSLTGTLTKVFFFERAEEIMEQNSKTEFCLFELDINRLTMINEMYGLSEGDRLLKFMGNMLNDLFSDVPNSLVSRIHADLFVVLCPYEDKTFRGYINRIEESVQKFGEEINHELLVSIGVYICKDRGLKAYRMCERANLALKSIKGNYYNHVAFYDEEMYCKEKQKLEISFVMSNALKNGEFVVYYQPKHSLDDNRIIGAEALVRWIKPDGTIISPAVFVPIFEENGFIMNLDSYVWEQTCKFISEKLAKGKRVPPISVNVSRIDMFNPNLVNIIINLTKKYGINPKMLRFEFTESAYIENEQIMSSVMHELQSRGFNIEMDDFGSGYSSLNVLKDLPVDALKVDMKFLSKTVDETKGKRILSAVIHMAKWLSIPSIVEGVEEQEQIDYLKNIGCTAVQGFYYSRPISEDEFVEYLDNRDEYGELQKPHIEKIISRENYWDMVRGDCEPILEMFDCYGIVEMNEMNEVDFLYVSDSFFETNHITREEMYTSTKHMTNLICDEDKERFLRTVNSVSDYHTIGKCIYRTDYDGLGMRWKSINFRLLEQVENNRIIFFMMDDITNSMPNE